MDAGLCARKVTVGRWDTRFGAWVRHYGAHNLGRALGLSGPYPVYQWVRGRTYPHPSHALRIVDMSGSKLTLEDIYRQHATAWAKDERRQGPS